MNGYHDDLMLRSLWDLCLINVISSRLHMLVSMSIITMCYCVSSLFSVIVFLSMMCLKM